MKTYEVPKADVIDLECEDMVMTIEGSSTDIGVEDW